MPETFADLYAVGEVTSDQFADYVKAWHESGDEETRELHEYLGLTLQEYARWVEQADALHDILDRLSAKTCTFCSGRRWLRVVGEHPFFVVTPEFKIKTLERQPINVSQSTVHLNQIDMVPDQQKELCAATAPLTAFDVCLGCGAKISCCRGASPFYSEEPGVGSIDWSEK